MRRSGWRRAVLAGCAAGAIAATLAAANPAFADPPPAAASTPTLASLAGVYDGDQTEIAARLELSADGRFRYALAYGALDEEAQGRWSVDRSQVLLTSDPVVPPRFVVLDQRRGQGRSFKLTLDLPAGMDRQYFNARIRLADGRSIERQLTETGLDLPLTGGERVVSVALLLPVYDLEGAAVPMSGGGGGEVHFRFDPNDLGKVAFAGTPLAVGPDGLTLERQGRTLVFRRSEAQ